MIGHLAISVGAPLAPIRRMRTHLSIVLITLLSSSVALADEPKPSIDLHDALHQLSAKSGNRARRFGEQLSREVATTSPQNPAEAGEHGPTVTREIDAVANLFANQLRAQIRRQGNQLGIMDQAGTFGAYAVKTSQTGTTLRFAVTGPDGVQAQFSVAPNGFVQPHRYAKQLEKRVDGQRVTLLIDELGGMNMMREVASKRSRSVRVVERNFQRGNLTFSSVEYQPGTIGQEHQKPTYGWSKSNGRAPLARVGNELKPGQMPGVTKLGIRGRAGR